MSGSGWFSRHPVLTGLLVVVLVVGWTTADDRDEPDRGTSAASQRSGVADRAAPERARNDPERQRPEPRRTARPDPPEKPRPKPPALAPRTHLVVHVVDGDTVDLANGERVRLVGMDTPERGECGYEESSARLSQLVLGRRVRLVESDEDRDGYGRLLRYLDVDGVDAGLTLVREGHAIARYDSRDGYGFHPREPEYLRADASSPDRGCPQNQPRGLVAAPPKQPSVPSQRGCEPGYAPCVPVFPPDVDCADVTGPIRVTGGDPHGLDRDGDGVACE